MMSVADFQLGRNPSWFHSHCPMLLHALTIPYGLAIRMRSQLYKRGWFAQRRLPRPVISVGNLTVGGTGKTPVVMWVANWLRSKGKRVGILSRGYRRTNKAECLLVSNGEEIMSNPTEVGDEPFLMARSCPGVIVAVGRDRYQLGAWLLKQMDIDCFVLDDGFQHLGLHRDCNLLLIDSLDSQGLEDLLPAGRLREPLSAAKRATAVLFTRVNQAPTISRLVDAVEKAMGTGVSPIHIHFLGGTVINLATREKQSCGWIKAKRAVICSGIGNAQSFRSTVESMGVTILEELVFPDHIPYSPEVVEKIRVRARSLKAEVILTTEKDGVKIEPLLMAHEDFWVVQLETTIGNGEKHLFELLQSTTM